ncbi:PepSY-associated TM helix domain-containing protein [Larkinella ripae]
MIVNGKKLIGKIHLWLGLSSGLVVLVVALTGCVLVFEQEIKQLTQPYWFVDQPPGGKPLPPSALRKIAEKALPGKLADGALYSLPNRSAEVGFYNFDPEYYYVVYINPYTGQVLHVWNEDDDFFHLVLHGHNSLWLPDAVGKPIVAWATVLFVVMLLSGLVLWWPKNRSAARQRFRIKWNAAWRRKNYDLHNVFGFYVLLVGLTFALTGLVWSFQWYSQTLYWATGGQGSDAYVIPPSDTTVVRKVSSSMEAVDRVWMNYQRHYPNHKGINMSFPQDQTASIYSYVNYREGTYYKVDYHYYNQHSLEEIPVTGPFTGLYANAPVSDKLRRMNYDIHVGAIGGLAGKILAFCASLTCATLPVTGFIIWWGRRKKSKKTARTIGQTKAFRQVVATHHPNRLPG